jgi:hypothetical protein
MSALEQALWPVKDRHWRRADTHGRVSANRSFAGYRKVAMLVGSGLLRRATTVMPSRSPGFRAPLRRHRSSSPAAD